MFVWRGGDNQGAGAIWKGGRFKPVPGAAVVEDAAVLERLDGPERRVLAELIADYPAEVEQRELAERAGYSFGGGYFKPRGRLKAWGLAEYVDSGRAVRAADLLFPEEGA